MPTTRRRRRNAHSSRVPTVHLVLIIIAFAIFIAGFVGHLFRPDDQLSGYLVTASLAALFGKLTNGFGKPFPDLLGLKDSDGDGQPDTEEPSENGKDS